MVEGEIRFNTMDKVSVNHKKNSKRLKSVKTSILTRLVEFF